MPADHYRHFWFFLLQEGQFLGVSLLDLHFHLHDKSLMVACQALFTTNNSSDAGALLLFLRIMLLLAAKDSAQ